MAAIGPQFYEFMKKLDENGGKLPTSITSRAFQPEFEFNNSTCYLCNGYYGPSFGEPVCVTCHAFLYPDIPNPSSFVFSEKTDDGDSGNDEPSVGEMLCYDRRLSRALHQRGIPNWAFRFQNSLDSETSPDDPIDLSYRPLFAISHNRDGPNGSGPSGIRPNIGGPGDPNESANDRGLNRDTHDEGPNRGLNGGFPNRVANGGGPNEGPGDVGPTRGPYNEGLNRGPNDEVPNRGPNIGDPNRRGSNDGGPNIVPIEGYPNIPNDGGPSAGPSNAGPSHDHGQGPAVPDDGLARPLPSSLARSLAALSTPRLPDNLAPGLVERLPSEVLLCMFSYMDDLSLCACAQVCVRWLRLVRARVSQTRWAAFASRRWPLFRPMLNIQDWHKKYQSLVESCFCRNCVVQMCTQSQPPFEENAWRRNRLRNEIKMLRNAPPEGCAATPLDPKCCHWQAMVTGPVGSPYEGGVFYLYIQVPFSYPMSPPVVRFLTRILHPNVSRHGDVGIDSVHHNWSLALTISKLLISIQSLLTDPYTAVCMEPDVGDMYVNERARFERIARRWTWRYAMHDMYTIN